MLVTMITSTLCDIWIENAPLNDDPCKLLAFTTSKWLFLSLFVPKLLRPTICDCYESIWIYFGPHLKQFAVLLLDILVRKIFHENETGVQFEDDKGENYVSLPVTGFDKGWRAAFFTFLDNDISFRRIIQIILAIVSVLGHRGAGFQVLKKILAEWLIS